MIRISYTTLIVAIVVGVLFIMMFAAAVATGFFGDAFEGFATGTGVTGTPTPTVRR